MLKRIVVGILGLTVLGAGGAAALYQSAQSAAAAPIQATNAPAAAPLQATGITAAAQPGVGDPWTASGTITTLDSVGFTLSASDGASTYVELGPASYWQAQGVTLAVGDSVTVNGYTADGLYHAGTVTTASGQTLALRDEAGRPLWSGGAGNGNGQGGAGGAGNGGANGQQNGSGVPQPQAQVDEWITVEGVITAMTGNTMTVQTTAGETLIVQLGRPSFAAEQGITFQIGDEVKVVGFYEGTQFSAGEITQVSTGLRLMLRDPNGRPLWAGQGNNRSGQSGQGGSGQGNGKGQGGNGQP